MLHLKKVADRMMLSIDHPPQSPSHRLPQTFLFIFYPLARTLFQLPEADDRHTAQTD